MDDPAPGPSVGGATIVVLAGVNGAGKSSIGGEALRQNGGEYFNPDEVARRYREIVPLASQADANSHAWRKGKEGLEQAIANGTTFAFETTLGGRSITATLIDGAVRKRAVVRMWYAGLESVELHIKRVAARVAKGGHHIEEADIRRRHPASHANVVRLIPHLANLTVYDNSREGDPAAGIPPRPRLVLAFDQSGISFPTKSDLTKTPGWAKPIVMAAIKRFGGNLPG
jgi:predicted ABC-type ATPase